MIFDEIDRNEHCPASHLIGKFDYLNTSDRIEAHRIRGLLNSWLGNYPDENRPELISRLRSRHDTLHDSSCFELIIHELMINVGFEIESIEPTLPNGRAPDFLVKTESENQFYLEATLATGMNQTEIGATRRTREAIQAIDNVNSPDFFLELRTEGIPSQPIRVSLLNRRVQNYVDQLDYNSLAETDVDNNGIDPFTYEEHGFIVTIRAFPKSTRGVSGRAIGLQEMPQGGVVQPHLSIKSAIEDKAGRYGELDIPLIIAVNAQEEFANEESVIDALFGTEAIRLVEGEQPRWVRNQDGAWLGPNGARNSRCSGVLFFRRLSPWSLGQRQPVLILNPWAQNQFNDAPPSFKTYRVERDRLVVSEGSALGSILGLPDNWPEQSLSN